MTSVSALLGDSYVKHPMKDRFLKWQCHVRQMMMRDNLGKPTDAVLPEVFLEGQDNSLGSIITIMNKLPMYSETPEMLHMARKTHDPAQRRSQALQYFSATYYQKYSHFSDILTATFQGASQGAAQILKAAQCRLVFEAYSQKFDLLCKVEALSQSNPLYVSTLAHNRLFNPDLPGETQVLGFAPDWTQCIAEP